MVAKPARYIIMSKQGFANSGLKSAEFLPADKPVALKARAAAVGSPSMRVLESIGDDGPKLVEMPPEGELSLRLTNPDLKIIPEVFYYPQWFRPMLKRRHVRKTAQGKTAAGAVKSKARTGARVAAQAFVATAGAGIAINVVDRATRKPLRGAHVVAFTDFANRTGDEGDSGADGVVRLNSISSRQAVERVYVYGPPGYWGYYAINTSGAALKTVELRAIDLTDASLLLRQLYGGLPADAEAARQSPSSTPESTARILLLRMSPADSTASATRFATTPTRPRTGDRPRPRASTALTSPASSGATARETDSAESRLGSSCEAIGCFPMRAAAPAISISPRR